MNSSALAGKAQLEVRLATWVYLARKQNRGPWGGGEGVKDCESVPRTKEGRGGGSCPAHARM